MIQIIPAIDLIGGECVRLTQGDYDRKTSYYKNPLDVAKKYEQAGIRRLHLVDLDGAKAAEPLNLPVLENIVAHTGLEVQYGGGIKSAESLQKVLAGGASRAICGSIAVQEPEAFRKWLREFGADRIILGADARNGFVSTHGWLETSTVRVDELIEQFTADGLTQVICTDIAQDGTLQGPSTPLYVELQTRFPDVEITVSGGISSWDDILELDRLGLRSVIVGKAIYEGRISFEQLAEWSGRAKD